MKQLKQWFIHRFSPLQQLLIIGGLARLVSAIFSKGFGYQLMPSLTVFHKAMHYFT
jgi:hypothetical protein